MEQEERKDGRFGDGSAQVIGALLEVHRCLGPGLLESVYEACLAAELRLRGLRFVSQLPVPLEFKGIAIECSFRADLVVEGNLLVELKAIERLLPIHEAQVITYLRLARLPVGLLVNFNVTKLRHGLRRLTPHPPFRSSALPVQSQSNE